MTVAAAEAIDAAKATATAQCLQSRALSRCLELPVLGGNRVELLHGAAPAAAALLQAIDHASDHINIEIRGLGPGDVGDLWIDHLLNRCGQGVHVNLLLDGPSPPSAQLARLRRGGVRVCESQPANPAWAWLNDNLQRREPSRTLIVVDGRVAFIGSLSPAAAWPGVSAKGLHRDPAVPGALLRIEGPSVAELQWLFIEDWKQRMQGSLRAGRYFPALAWVGAHRVGIAPAGSQSNPSPLARALIAAVDAAQDRALLVCSDGLPAKPLERALAAACTRGVDVHLLLASGTQGWLQRQSARAQAMQLVRSGMHVHELKDARPRGAASVIDGVWSSVAVGPAGLPVREQDHVIVLDAQFGALTEEDFWSDAEHCDEPFADPWTRPSVLQRLNLRLARYLEVSL